MFRRKHEKYITFTVPVEKQVTRIDKNGEEITKNIYYILQFIDSARYSLSNLSEGIHRIICKYEHDDRKCETCGINISIATVFLNTQILKVI